MWRQQQNLELHQLCPQKLPLPPWKGRFHTFDVSHRHSWLYQSWQATRDPDSEQTFQNKDQLVFEGLQLDDMKAQLTAADVMQFSFLQPFGVIIRYAATDVLSVSQYIQVGEFLMNTSTNHAFVMSWKVMQNFMKRPSSCLLMWNVLWAWISFPLLRELSADYLQARCQKAAAASAKLALSILMLDSIVSQHSTGFKSSLAMRPTLTETKVTLDTRVNSFERSQWQGYKLSTAG